MSLRLTYLTDVTILREGLKLARRLGEAAPLASSMTGETAPGSEVQSDEQWEDWLRGQVGTEFHPSSTCAMLPLEQGGVVDANLRVYGLTNVRVADASVPPTVFSAHLMASTYGVAEQASTMIRAFHNDLSSTSSASSSHNGTKSGSNTSPAAAADSSASNTSSSSGAKHTGRDVGIGIGVPVGVMSLAALLWFCLRSRRRTKPVSGGVVFAPVPSTEALDQPELVGGAGPDPVFKYDVVEQAISEKDESTKKGLTVKIVEVPSASANSSRVDLLGS